MATHTHSLTHPNTFTWSPYKTFSVFITSTKVFMFDSLLFCEFVFGWIFYQRWILTTKFGNGILIQDCTIISPTIRCILDLTRRVKFKHPVFSISLTCNYFDVWNLYITHIFGWNQFFHLHKMLLSSSDSITDVTKLQWIKHSSYLLYCTGLSSFYTFIVLCAIITAVL